MNLQDLVFVIEVGKKNTQLLHNFVKREVKNAIFKEIDDYIQQSSLQRKMFLCILDMTEKKMMDYIPNNEGKFKGLRRMKNLKILIFHNEKNEFFNFSKFFKSFLKVDVNVTPLKHDSLTQELLQSQQAFLNQWIFTNKKQQSPESVSINSKEKPQNRLPKPALLQQPAANKDSPKENINQSNLKQQLQAKASENFTIKLDQLRREQTQQIRSLNLLIAEQQLSLSQLKETLGQHHGLNQQIQTLNSLINQQHKCIIQLRSTQSEMQSSFLKTVEPLSNQIAVLKQSNLELQRTVSELQSRPVLQQEKQSQRAQDQGVAERLVNALNLKVESLQNQNLALRQDKLKFQQRYSQEVLQLSSEISALRLLLQQKTAQKQTLDLNTFNQFRQLKSQLDKITLAQKQDKEGLEQFKGQLRDFIMPLHEKVSLLQSLAPAREVINEILQ